MASNVIKVDGNYKIVAKGGSITLDTTSTSGNVYITGNLIISGTTTNVGTIDLIVKDNIIVLNSGETGPGVGQGTGTSGFVIDRGSGAVQGQAQLLWDETLNRFDPVNRSTRPGTFIFKAQYSEGFGTISGIRTNYIDTGTGNSLASKSQLIINTGQTTISVTGTENYETHVTDDDDIPNKKFVDDHIINTRIPTTSNGLSGDKAGMMAADEDNLYYCTTNYTDGLADIWVKTPWTSTGTW